MGKHDYIFNEICTLTGIGIFCYENKELKTIKSSSDYNPIKDAPGFCEMLIELADRQEIPVVYQDIFEVLYVCIKEDKYYLLGPMSLSNMTKVELHRYYQSYGMKRGMEKNFRCFYSLKRLRLWG